MRHRTLILLGLSLAALTFARMAAMQSSKEQEPIRTQAGITVNSTAQSPGSTGDCTLGEAIIAANQDTAVDGCSAGAGDDTIMLPAGIYELSAVDNNIGFVGPTGLPGITSNVTIQGAGSASTVIRRAAGASQPFRLLAISDQNSGSLVLNDLSLRGGRAGATHPSSGGGLYTFDRPVTLNRVVVDDNRAGYGGGVGGFDGGQVTINDCTFTNNAAVGRGGAINGARVTIARSSFSGNSADHGGVLIGASGSANIANISDSTFVNNAAVGAGGVLNFGGTVTIMRSTFNNNSGGFQGGALNVVRTLSVSDSIFLNNSLSNGGGAGGAISYSSDFPLDGTATIESTTFDSNSTPAYGGAVDVRGQGAIRNSTFRNNTAGLNGGGIHAFDVNLVVSNVTLSGNVASQGGGIYNQVVAAPDRSMLINSVTAAGNRATNQGGGLFRASGTITFRNSLFAANTSDTGFAQDMYGTFLVSGGYNLVGIKDGAVFSNGAGDQTGDSGNPVDPLLGPLQVNGGATLTRALMAGSPAIDSGSPEPAGGSSSCEAADQRGVLRPADGGGGARCDKGAFERTRGSVRLDSATYNVIEGAPSATITVLREFGDFGSLSADYSTADGTATSGSDYMSASGTLDFPDPSVSQQTFQVPIIDDSLDEPAETFSVLLSGSAVTAPSSAVVTITDNDPPAVSVGDVTVTEGNAGPTIASFPVTLSSAHTSPITVDFQTSDITTTAGSDYQSISGQLVFGIGETSKTIDVTVNGDTDREPDESFNLVITNVVNGTVGDGAGAGTILNDDFITDLGLTTTDNPGAVPEGGDVTYTLTISNSQDRATSVILTDTIPAGVTFISANASQGTCNYFSGIVSCSLGTIQNSSSAQVTIIVRTSTPGTISNTATVTSAEPDQDPANNTDQESTIVLPVAEISVTEISMTPRLANGRGPNETETFRLLYSIVNNGPRPATNMAFTLQLPPSTTLIDSQVLLLANTACSQNGDVLTCSGYNELKVGRQAAVSVLLQRAAGAANAVATVNAFEYDTNTPNNSVTTVLNIWPAADLFVSKRVQGPASIETGADFNFVIDASNRGPSPAANVVITDELPAGFTYGMLPAGCTSSTSKATCHLGNLTVGTETQLILPVTATGTPGDYTASAQVSSIVDDGNAETFRNNTSTLGLRIYPPAPAADISIVQAVTSSGTVREGDPFTITMSVHNSGPNPAQGVFISYTSNNWAEFLVSNGWEHVCLSNQCWRRYLIGDLAPGVTRNVELNLRPRHLQGNLSPIPPFFERFVNTAAVGSSTSDSDPSDNRSDLPINVRRMRADLRLLVTIPQSIPHTISQNLVPTANTFLNDSQVLVTNFGPDAAEAIIVTDSNVSTTPVDSATYRIVGPGAMHQPCAISSDRLEVTCTVGQIPAFGGVIVEVKRGLIHPNHTPLYATPEHAKVKSTLYPGADPQPWDNGFHDASSTGSTLGMRSKGDAGPEIPSMHAHVPAGSNVVVEAPPASVTFGQVNAPGSLNVMVSVQFPTGQPIQIPYPDLPNGFSIAGSGVVYNVSTTAATTPPIDICFNASFVNSPTVFANLRILHEESGTLIDRTTTRDFTARKVCAVTSSLDKFVLTQAIDASHPMISGFTQTSNGDPIAGVTIVLTGPEGNLSTFSDAAGNYNFPNLQQGAGYSMLIFHPNYSFAPASADIPNLPGNHTVNFTGTAGVANVAEFSVSAQSVSESAGTATVTINRTGDLSRVESLAYSTSDLSALSDDDYMAKAGLVMFVAGQSSASITVPIVDNLSDGPDRAFRIVLSQVGKLQVGNVGSVDVTIADDDAPATFSIAPGSAREGDTGTTFVPLAVTLSAPSTQARSIQFSTLDGTATAGTDYVAASGTIVFGPGETSKLILVTVLNEDLIELDETFSVVLDNNGSRIMSGASSAIATIVNDDFVPTAATVPVSGYVTRPDGTAIGGALVTALSPSGTIMTSRTNPFGRYQFDALPVGTTYLFSITAKRHTFNPRTVSVVDEMNDVNFESEEP